MDISDRVAVYTHESSDANHSTVDSLAMVLAIPYDGCADVVIFPIGGPVRFARVNMWDSDGPLPPPGGTYYREWGQDPPDFHQAYRHYGDERFQNLLRKQQGELDRAPPKNRDDMLKAQKEEQDKLLGEIDGDEKPESGVEVDEKARLERESKLEQERAKAEAQARAQSQSRSEPATDPATDMNRRV